MDEMTELPFAKSRHVRGMPTRAVPGRPCFRCKKPVTSVYARVQFCTPACAYEWRRERRRERDMAAARECPVCKRVAPLVGHTCSKACGYAFRRARGGKPIRCKGCRKQFHVPPSTRAAGRAYCTAKCRQKHVGRPRFMTWQCANCGGSFKRTYAAVERVNRVYCSQRCQHEKMVREEHPSWRGGHDPNRGPDWVKIAREIRKRDGHKCRRCGKTRAENKQALSVDHVRPWRSFEDKQAANDPGNLVSLCRKCHAWKSATVERRWLQGDVLGLEKFIRSVMGELQ